MEINIFDIFFILYAFNNSNTGFELFSKLGFLVLLKLIPYILEKTQYQLSLELGVYRMFGLATQRVVEHLGLKEDEWEDIDYEKI